MLRKYTVVGIGLAVLAGWAGAAQGQNKLPPRPTPYAPPVRTVAPAPTVTNAASSVLNQTLGASGLSTNPFGAQSATGTGTGGGTPFNSGSSIYSQLFNNPFSPFNITGGISTYVPVNNPYTIGNMNSNGGYGGGGYGGGYPTYFNPQANPYTTNPHQNPLFNNPFATNPYMSNPYMSNPYMNNPYMSNPYMNNPYASPYNAYMGNPYDPTAPNPYSALLQQVQQLQQQVQQLQQKQQ